MITSIALIFLLDIFLTDLVKAPKCFTFLNMIKEATKKGRRKCYCCHDLYSRWNSNLDSIHNNSPPFWLPRRFKGDDLLNCFSELDPIPFLIKCMHLFSCDSGRLNSMFAIKVRARMFGSVRLKIPACPPAEQMIELKNKLLQTELAPIIENLRILFKAPSRVIPFEAFHCRCYKD